VGAQRPHFIRFQEAIEETNYIDLKDSKVEGITTIGNGKGTTKDMAIDEL